MTDTSKPYEPSPREPLRTIDHPATDERGPTPEALAVLRGLVNATKDGQIDPQPMAAPHVGERLSQRQVARKLLAGRSYQAVQAWLAGEPIPRVTAEWLTEDLQRVDAQEVERMVRVAADEIAILVKR